VRVLVAGASGFVGRRLCAALAETGHDIAAMTRNPAAYAGAGTPVQADVHRPGTLGAAMAGCQAAYYLVHSLSDADFERKDAAAVAFGQEGARPRRRAARSRHRGDRPPAGRRDLPPRPALPGPASR
jgi:uncharacterized protein YbjT (DUF2867 family)